MADLLTPDDLAYMRSTQADARPTAAALRRKVAARTATGGTVTTWGNPVPVTVRVDASPDEVPTQMASRMGTATPYKIVMDTGLDVRDGDRLEVSPAEAYELVSDGDPDRWATAQVLWARRTAFPPRTA